MTLQSALIYLAALLLSYLIGAIPNGVIIGKVFYKKDVREYGSHNSGGTNTGRVLGKKAGVIVIILDAVKIIIPFWIVIALVRNTAMVNYVQDNIMGYLCLIGACVGHCYSPYIGFKGGKAVATFAGCLLATSWALFILFFGLFLLILYLKKMVSLSSVASSITATLLSCLLFIPSLSFLMWPSLAPMYIYQIALLVNTLLLIWRHRENIKRIVVGQESKITWM